MGYSTDFFGRFQFDKPLTAVQVDYLKKFSKSRRLARDISKLTDKSLGLPLIGIPKEVQKLIDDISNLGYSVAATPIEDKRTPEEIFGAQGEYYVGDENIGVKNANYAPYENLDVPEEKKQPGLYCQWVPTDDGTELEWDGGEKFYDYIPWLKYLINHFFIPWGVKLNGEVEWSGEERGDIGVIIVKNNVVTVKQGKITY